MGKLALDWSLRDRDDILPAALSSKSNRAQAMLTERTGNLLVRHVLCSCKEQCCPVRMLKVNHLKWCITFFLQLYSRNADMALDMDSNNPGVAIWTLGVPVFVFPMFLKLAANRVSSSKDFICLNLKMFPIILCHSYWKQIIQDYPCLSFLCKTSHSKVI